MGFGEKLLLLKTKDLLIPFSKHISLPKPDNKIYVRIYSRRVSNVFRFFVGAATLFIKHKFT
jgi:hypothetical protein